MKAVVLAHERALTLEPFSTTRPRSLIPVLNVPVIGHLLRALAAADVPDAQITTGHLGEAVAAYVAGEDPAGLRIGTVTVESPDELARVLLEALRGSEEPLLILDGATYMEEGLLREVIQAGTSLLPAEGGAFGLGVN
ncbi:MAG: hypothetical protein HY321_01245, partial [Armatimonadetes bacterium]|nr:hypothetical protein [Armatimonadota bacterium]